MTASALVFGTAGVRGVMGPEEGQFNVSVVERITAALCLYLPRVISDAAHRGVCIGFDARHHSREFAEIACEVLTAQGIHVHIFNDVVPTPLLAFSVKHTHAAAGIMITASHNPPQYNGYKLYWENGAQILPPHDERMLAELAALPPHIARTSAKNARDAGLITNMDTSVRKAYLDYIQSLLPKERAPASLCVAYTPLHGVGAALFKEALATVGFRPAMVVPEQAQPDPDFPTVAFPNPEEPHAMDRVLSLAQHENADLAIAHDPDADRLAVAAPDAQGAWHLLTGNEVGALLGDYLLALSSPDEQRLVLSTIVSSPLLGRIAEAYGARWEHTLTGFKWLMNRAHELNKEHYTFVFAYEEALGYAVSDAVADKDGISAAILLMSLASKLKHSGQTLYTQLESLWRRFGVYQSLLGSIEMHRPEEVMAMDATLSHLRKHPPAEWAHHPIEAVIDYENQTRILADGMRSSLKLPSSNVIGFELKGHHRVMLRPSGTEPKMKIYIDICEPLNSEGSLSHAKTAASQKAHQVLNWTLDYLKAH